MDKIDKLNLELTDINIQIYKYGRMYGNPIIKSVLGRYLKRREQILYDINLYSYLNFRRMKINNLKTKIQNDRCGCK